MDRSLATVYGIAKSLIELSMQRNKIWFLKYKADKNETGPERLSEDQKRLVFSASMYPGESWSQHRDFSPKGVKETCPACPFWKLWGLNLLTGEKSNLFSAPTASWAKAQCHGYLPTPTPPQSDLISPKKRKGSLPLFGDLFLTIRNSCKSHLLSQERENYFSFKQGFAFSVHNCLLETRENISSPCTTRKL